MKVFKELDLSDYNSYKIKAICKKAYFPENENELRDLIAQEGMDSFIILGNGNNIILSKEYYDKSFIILRDCLSKIETQGNIITAEAGVTTLSLSEEAFEQGLTGAEFLYDIPSSIGGAVVMNAGTKEGETKNILQKVRYLDCSDMKIKEKIKGDLELSYRKSYFQKYTDKIILKAWFELQVGDQQEIRKVMEESKSRRWSKQPRDYPNCGSVFKRPPNMFVGPMLDKLGFKGFSVGHAEVSMKHSGFIVNKGNATGEDILSLVKIIQEKVFNEFGVNLQLEQRII